MPNTDLSYVQKVSIDTSMGWVEINGVQFDGVHMPCFGCPDISWALDGPAIRGDDRILPGTAGVVPYPRRVTVTKRSMPVIIIGAVDRNGIVQTDYAVGLQNNRDYLENTLVLPAGTSPYTYTATLHKPDGTTKTAACVAEHFTAAYQGGMQIRAVLDLSFPRGYFQ